MTGVDRNSEIHPIRNRPNRTRRPPTNNAVKAIAVVNPAVPTTATDATPMANTGAMVESAPTDSWWVLPTTAYTRDPATNAYRPVTGERLASTAVAICEGRTTATRARPASASAPSQARR